MKTERRPFRGWALVAFLFWVLLLVMEFFHIVWLSPLLFWTTFALAILFFIIMLGKGQVPG